MKNINNQIKKEIELINKRVEEIKILLEREDTKDMKNLLQEEQEILKKQKQDLVDSLNSLDIEKSTNDTDEIGPAVDPNIIILEIRAGTGGDEAGLFAKDLYKMYGGFSEKMGWKHSVLFISENEVGGIKTIAVEIKGKEVYEMLKHESGVHRVQRVPVTESGGRIHTSTATVAVLPKLKKTDIEIKQEDLKWDFFRSGGSGGQNVNKVSTAVRLTHVPTDTVVECQQERTQGRNREKALEMLNSKLFTLMHEQNVKNITQLRSSQVGTGERSEKIRTYNFPQDRITDHRVKKSWNGIENIIDGDLDKILKLVGEVLG